MSGKTKKTFMCLDGHDEWVRSVSSEKGVDQSFIINRALSYYKEKGIKRDKLLKKMSEGEL